MTARPWLVDDPVTLGPRTLKGRVYVPAHQPGLAEGGRPGERYIAYQRARARAGVAMQVTGATPILPSREWSDICLWNVDESIVPGYRRLAEAVHEEGGTMLAQLAHPGPTEFAGAEVVGASWDFSEVSRQVAVPARADQLSRITDLYAAAADRCARGGLDGVEISMAHGLLLASFLSPLTNRRDDAFGGSFERRLEYPIRVLDAVRATVGADLIVGIRLGVDDLVAGGLVPEDAAHIARALQDRVDYISVMVGNNNRFESRFRHWPPTPAPYGLFRDHARTIKQAVDKPVCAVGRVTSVELANDILVAGDADLVGMVRAHIADPDLLPKSRAGLAHEVRPCIGANACVNGLLAEQPTSCVVNPDVGHEAETPATPRGGSGSAVVVGGGPAGLEAARRLGAAGLHVTLYEAEDRLGGQLADWSRAPSRQEFARFVAWQRDRLTALGVDVRTGHAADAATVLASDADVTVVATGATPAALPLDESDETVRRLDPLSALRRGVAGSVVVFDSVGELGAALVAEHLAASGSARVTLATSRLHVGEGEGLSTLVPMLRALAERGVTMVDRVRVAAIRAGEVRLDGVLAEPSRSVPADTLVSWRGGVPVTALADELRAHGAEPVVVGDALRPRDVLQAVQEARSAVETALRGNV